METIDDVDTTTNTRRPRHPPDMPPSYSYPYLQQQQQGRDDRLPSFLCVDPPSPSSTMFLYNSTTSQRRHRLAGGGKPVSPRRPGMASTKRKQQDTSTVSYYYNETPVYIEPCLVQLCRLNKWKDALERCDLFRPEMCLVQIPMMAIDDHFGDRLSITRSLLTDHHPEQSSRSFTFNEVELHPKQQTMHPQNQKPAVVFRETALGIVCASKAAFDDGEREKLVQALVDINPYQVGASQLLPGHTAIRDAILNDMCSVKVLEILLDAHNQCCGDDVSAYYQKDSDGLTPLDHLIVSTQLGTPVWAVDRLKAFIRIRGDHRNKKSSSQQAPLSVTETGSSPLSRLLAMGNSYEVQMSSLLRQSPRGVSPLAGNSARKCCSNTTATKDQCHLRRIFEVAKCLLDDDPSLLTLCSRMTGCLPIHIALRNYGNFEPLIRLLLERDTVGRTMKVRNIYGDLPLHVACSVGVPLSILRLILNQTIQAAHSNSIRSTPAGCNHLIWSENNSGFTPVDLEWVRNVESGGTLHTARTFYPLEWTGVRKHCANQNDFYRKLLNDAVSKFMQNPIDLATEIYSDDNRVPLVDGEEDAQARFGCLLDRISLLIHAAATGMMSGEICTAEHRASVSDVCKLCTPYSPNLPLPLMNLYLWLNPNDVTVKDSTGKLPIHHAVSRDKKSTTCSSTSTTAVNDWQAFVLDLLKKCPNEHVRQRSYSGRLPLHYALDHSSSNNNSKSVNVCQDEDDGITMLALQNARHDIIEKLVSIFPEAVDQRDPVSGLYPYMMASVDSALPLDTVFCLLRHSPSRCTTLPPP